MREDSCKSANNTDIIRISSDEDEDETKSVADSDTGTEVNIVTKEKLFSMFG